MKLKNTTGYTDEFIRRMMSWIAKQLKMPTRFCKEATFRNKSFGCSGRCWHWSSGCRIVCSIAKCESVDSLVRLTAHELRHAQAELTRERTRGSGRLIGSSERVTELDAQKVLAVFSAHRDELLAEWSQPRQHRRKK